MFSNRYKIFLIPFITILMMLAGIFMMVVLGFRTFEQLQEFSVQKFVTVLSNAFISVFTFYFLVQWLNRHLLWSKNWLLRLFLDIAMVLAYTSLLFLFFKFLMSLGWTPPHKEETLHEALFMLPLMANTLFMVMVELILSVEERNELAVQLAQMEKEQINAKYGALKEQLDHHFLFNNLSVLSSLIYEDVEKADHFIQDFSSTYRYVLQINQRNLVTVQEELEFIENYLHLYKFRFEEGFNYSLNVDKETRKNMLIPPLTLQVLVENAIKHNRVSRQQPLHLEIISTNQQLIVQNTLQPKPENQPSTQKGQVNLVEKYRLLGSDLPEFTVKDEKYVVKIPLIKSHED